MPKFYAVRQGRETGIFESWAICEKQVKGFPGAIYKSFKTRQEAEAFMNQGARPQTTDNAYPCAYVDGSYDKHTHSFSFGAVILASPDEEAHFSQAFTDTALADLRNVAGEMKGSEFAIQYALDHGWAALTIYYDYLGIEHWATGTWKRNLPETQAYHAFCQDAFLRLTVHFVKVKSHSGNHYNDLADKLARRAINL
ncbi:MAG: ribonuclease H family protein [Peptococcaceae bacterium]|nr:ribonuclease H family protein [Peptococcaceae bacterium]